MTTVNTIKKTFGPVGSFAGIIIAAAGIILAFYSLSAIILVLFGLLAGFTASKTAIDKGKRRIRHYQSYFGFINIGKWREIDPEMKLFIIRDNLTYRSYSRGNRILDLKKTGFLILLKKSDDHEIIPVKRTITKETAEEEMGKLSKWLYGN